MLLPPRLRHACRRSAADTETVEVWRTKVGGGPVVTHPTQDAAYAAVDNARARYRAGARALRVVRVYDPAGEVRLVDFEAEARAAQRALEEVVRTTQRKDREVRAALERWESAIEAALSHGEDEQAIADAAGVTVREVRAIARRRRAQPPRQA